MSNITEKTFEDFYSTDYREYAIYVVEQRAIPAISDGLKPGFRKILHAALSTLKPGKFEKMSNLIGSVYKESAYHHGPASLESTIMLASSQYINTLAQIDIDGAGGTLRSYASAAPRYLDVSLSKYASIFEQDSEILEYNYDGEDRIEPKYYLPILPMAFLTRASGIAIGYSYNNPMSYHPLNIVQACRDHINKQTIKQLEPYVHEYDGYWEMSSDNRLMSKAHCEYHKDKIVIRSLPVSETYSSFEKNLIKLLDKGAITKWVNESENGKIKYTIHVNQSKLETILERGLQHKIFKTGEYIQKPTLYMLDENKKIIHFDNVTEAIKYFVDFRCKKYDTLRKHKIKAFEERRSVLDIRRQFIDLYLNGTIVINKDTSIETIEKQLAKYKIPKDVLQIPIRSLTKDMYNKLGDEITEINHQIEYYTKTSKETLYLNDLDKLEKVFGNDFPRQEFKK